MIKEKCSSCGYDKHKGSLHIHHKDNNHENNNQDNLIVLCANCHMELHQKDKKHNNYKRENRIDHIRELECKIESLEYDLNLYKRDDSRLHKIIRVYQDYVPREIRKQAFEEYEGEIARRKPII